MGHALPYRVRFKEAVRQVVRDESIQVFTFWKGRVALYAILKAMNIRHGDEVIIPAFTCVVVPNAVMYLGGVPVYVDIDPHTYNMDAGKISAVISKRSRFILAQNTYGLSSDLDAVRDVARTHDLRIIEDCAHGFGGTYKGRANGTVADAAFFSTQWNKPFSTGLGGIAVTRDQDIAGRLRAMEQEFPVPSFRDRTSLRMLWFVRERVLNAQTYWTALYLYRWLSRHNLVLGSSQGIELEHPVEPKYFVKGFSDFQAKTGIHQLNSFEKTLMHRKRLAAEYNKILIDLAVEPPLVPSFADHGYLKYPLLVKERTAIFRSAVDERIELGDWFLSPLHPVNKNFQNWNYRWGENPIAEKISRHVINLPTHTDVNDKYIDRIRTFLKKIRGNIFQDIKECLAGKGD